MRPPIVRAYRFYLTVYIEGDPESLPPINEIAEYVATQVQDEYDHDLSNHVRPIESEDYRRVAGRGWDDLPKTTDERPNPRKRRTKRCDDVYVSPDRDGEGPHYRCTLDPGHGGEHCMMTHPMQPAWPNLSEPKEPAK